MNLRDHMALRRRNRQVNFFLIVERGVGGAEVFAITLVVTPFL